MLDQILEQSDPFGDYESVLKQMAVKDGKILEALAGRSAQPEKKKPFTRFSKQQRGDSSGAQGESGEFRKFLNESGELDDDKMVRAGMSTSEIAAIGRKYTAYVRKVKSA
jgi:hypothetical protein